MPLEHLGFDELSQSLSLGVLLTHSLALLITAGIFVSLALDAARRARDARAAVEGARDLVDGATVIVGVVEADEDDSPIVLTLHEIGREWRIKNSDQHEWREERREVKAEPFFLVTDRKERIHVEPNARVVLVDDMRVGARRSSDRRERRATLDVGERATITGLLSRRGSDGGGAYRSGPAQWVFGPSRGGRMVVSTTSLADRHTSWSRFWAGLALVPIALLAGVSAVAYPTFYDFVLHGTPDVATVVDHDHGVTHDSHGAHQHYELVLETEQLETRLRVPADGFDRAPIGSRVAVVTTPSARLALGHDPGIQPATALVLMSLWVAIAALYGLVQGRKLWWEQKRVITRGQGRLV